MVYFQLVWGDPLFLCILVPQLAKKMHVQTKSLERQDLRKREGRA